MLKRYLSFLFVLTMAFSVLSIPASADEGEYDDENSTIEAVEELEVRGVDVIIFGDPDLDVEVTCDNENMPMSRGSGYYYDGLIYFEYHSNITYSDHGNGDATEEFTAKTTVRYGSLRTYTRVQAVAVKPNSLFATQLYDSGQQWGNDKSSSAALYGLRNASRRKANFGWY